MLSEIQLYYFGYLSSGHPVYVCEKYLYVILCKLLSCLPVGKLIRLVC
jgi:hypothetical protein